MAAIFHGLNVLRKKFLIFLYSAKSAYDETIQHVRGDLNDADQVHLLLGNDDTKAININAKR